MFALWYQVLKIKINDVQQKFYLLEQKTQYLKINKTWTRKKPQKLKLDQMQFSTMQNFAKKDVFWPNFGQIL